MLTTAAEAIAAGGGIIVAPAAGSTKSAKEEAFAAFCAFVGKVVMENRRFSRNHQIIQNGDFAMAAADVVTFAIKTFGGIVHPRDFSTAQRDAISLEVMDALKRNPKRWPMKSAKTLKAWF